MANVKHMVHTIIFITYIWLYYWITDALTPNPLSHSLTNPLVKCVVVFMQILSVIALPQYIFQFLGLIVYNPFSDDVVPLKSDPLSAPFICFRVVTRGMYRRLVADNVKKHVNVCSTVGLKHFMIEVVTDNPLDLDTTDPRVREIVVPVGYRPKNGTMFKARALQYRLDTNDMADDEWIVHLDEETVMTEQSVRGVVNFVSDGRHDFGQGLITYADQQVVNPWTTLLDTQRVADDMGKLRFQFKYFNDAPFSWKGSFMVCRVKAELLVSFDHGLEGSIAEDMYFSMRALMGRHT
ncbi:unnamed protein product, partial [Medioppia subpectinata]